MHIARQTSQELVVVAGTRWVSAICAAGALFTLYVVFVRHERGAIFMTAFLSLFALGMDLRKTFTFDARQRTVRWKGRKRFKAESGEIPFGDITDIGTQMQSASSGSGGRQVPIYRLTIVTAQATIPMSYAYNGQPDGYAALRAKILAFVRPDSAKNSNGGAGVLRRKD